MAEKDEALVLDHAVGVAGGWPKAPEIAMMDKVKALWALSFGIRGPPLSRARAAARIAWS